MATTIKILPGGREFISEGHSNILEAGLSSGLRLGYGCSNGNCGECLAKVISGEVQKVRHHDYRISDARKADGYVLMCCNRAVSNVVLEAPEASGASEIPQQSITAKVKSIDIINDDTALIHFKTPRTNRLRFLAGQHIQMGGNGIPAATHSIGSCPCDDMHLHFQLPFDPDDEFSRYVFDGLRVGDPVELNGPMGNFILDENSPRALVFIAWRTGFGPIRSLVEHAMSLEVAETIHLVWVAANDDDRYLDNLCRSWADALDDFYYIPVDVDVSVESIDIDREIISRLNTDPVNLLEQDFYIAGNQVLLDGLKETLDGLGLPAGQLNLDCVLHN